ncbi:MAG: 4-carboxy-2-hydroxymuconate-6-semialdehyde dehydrogenase [Candidatus Heimdallarchaeota archaeon LC_2]|nr:MAG: 4-carboxy-2-hydroxymuconate-6-semialdehyde dehydrogenase [Candidatus Heimdallarchaeota archaeon LC_2]
MVHNVGIIGTGFGAKVHLPALIHHPDFKPLVIAGRNKEKADKVATEYGIKSTTNWKDLLENDDLDLITVSTPPYLHYEMGKAVLQSGKHLLLEKPTTTNAAMAKKLVTLAEDKNLIALMAHEFRWVPSRNMLRKLIFEDQVIGKLREIHFNQFYGWLASPTNPKFGWLWDSKYDGGMLGALGSHLIDMIRYITGLEFLEVQGRIYRRTPLREDNSGKMVKQTADDGFLCEFKMENGVTGVLNASGTVGPSPPSRLLLSGFEGTIYLEGDDIFVGKQGGEFVKVDILEELLINMEHSKQDHRIPPFIKLLDQLSKSLQLGKSLSPSIFDGYKNQQVVDAIKQSHKLNTRITILD